MDGSYFFMKTTEERNINLENAFLKVALDAVVSMDAGGRILEFNPAAEKIFGRERGAVLGREMADVIIPPHYREAHRKGLEKFNSSGEQQIFGKRLEMAGLHSSGREFPIELTITQLSSDPVVFTGFIRDITEKKELEESLRKSRRDLEIRLAQTEERFQIMIWATEDYAIIMLDPDGYVLTWNEGAKKIHGFEAIDIVGKHVSEFYIEGDRIRQKPQRELNEARRDSRVDDEGYLRRKNGTVFWASSVLTALKDESGKLIGYSRITRDLTERKRHEDKLRQMRDELQVQVEEQTRELSEQRDQLDIILSGISDGIAVMDESGDFVYVNDAGARICGLTNAAAFMARPSELLFENFHFSSEKGEEINLKEQQIDPALRGEKPNELLARFRLKDTGEEKWLMIRISPVYDNKRNVRMAVSIFKDFTERKRIEDWLIEEKKRAEEAHLNMERLAEAAESASHVKSLFLANMSHEIRTPLGAILGFTDLLNDPELTPAERDKYRSIIERNGRQLTQLIDDILDLSKVEAGHLDIENLEISLSALLADIDSILKFRASEKGLTFELVSEPSAPESICTDPVRLRQILLNIVGNAIKFTEHGGVRIHVSSSGENKRNVKFVVEDTGLGISKENQEKLFEWFTQADSSTTRKFGGTGLGLALSRRLARALGGDIELESSDKVGSRFVITITNRNETGECSQIEPAKKNKHAHLKDVLKGLKILLVEDSADNRMLVESVLGRQGIKVSTAENGREGVEKAMNGDFDLILMDIQMPVLDGIQATTELRARGFAKPIVALTAHAMKEEREKTLGVGCDAHLTKPLVVSKLLNVIAEFTRPAR